MLSVRKNINLCGQRIITNIQPSLISDSEILLQEVRTPRFKPNKTLRTS